MSGEYTGKDVSYYLVTIHKPKRLEPYTAECEDIIETLGMSFAEGCAFKAIWRKCAARTLGLAKAGYKGGLYDAEKAHYYGARMVAVEQKAPLEDYDETRGLPSASADAVRYALSPANQRVTPEPEDVYVEFAKRVLGDAPKVSVHIGKQPECPECGYPTDAAGTHYATCSQLTAPEEYKAEAQVAFDEAAELSDALARHVSAGKIDTDFDELESAMVAVGEKMMAKHCPTCGAAEGAFHKPDCTVMRRGKSRLAAAYAESRAAAKHEEPAAAMDDDSPRMQAIGQNGNDGEHYDDPWAGAPDWAKYKAQDADGEWWFYSHKPALAAGLVWEMSVFGGAKKIAPGVYVPNKKWRDTLIERPNNKSQE